MSFNANIFFENWKCWMGLEVINQVLNEYPVRLDLKSIAKELNIDSKRNKLLESSCYCIQERLLLNKEIVISPEIISHLQIKIEHYWQTELCNTIGEEFKSIKDGQTVALKSLLSSNIKHSSPLKLMIFMQELCLCLMQQKHLYSRKKEDAILREIAVQKSLFNLCTDTDSEYANAKLNAINLMYRAKIECELYTQSTLYFDSLYTVGQAYLDSLSRTVTVLEQVAKIIKAKCSLRIITLPVFSLLDKLDTDKQKQLLEVWAGHQISSFGNAPISPQQIESKLMQNLDPAIQDLGRDFQIVYEEHFVFSKRMARGNN